MEKFPQAYEVLKSKVTIAHPMELMLGDLERVHTPTYLESVSFDLEQQIPGLPTYDRNRLGLPAHPQLLERSKLETAGTVSATLCALDQGMSANLAGGTHHAFPDRGLGFCVLNDVAVAIEYLRANNKMPDQILIIDTDAHQGNANHAFYRNDPQVFTYSIHVGKNYPAAKEAGDKDVPLERYVSGETYLRMLKETLADVLRSTEPDLIFWISGADPHKDDRFGQMGLSDQDMAERDTWVLDQCRFYEAPVVALYGGGYNKTPGKTGQLHAETILRCAAAFDGNRETH